MQVSFKCKYLCQYTCICELVISSFLYSSNAHSESITISISVSTANLLATLTAYFYCDLCCTAFEAHQLSAQVCGNTVAKRAADFYECQTTSNSMEQSPSWEVDSHSTHQEIPCLSWNTNVNHDVLKSPIQDHVLSHLNPAHVITSCFLKIYCNILLPLVYRSCKWSLPLRFSEQTFVLIFFLSTICATYYCLLHPS
jgi:hypothetical protein